MRAVSIYATAVVTAAMLAPSMGAYAQDSKLSVPNVTVTAPAAPVEPPYMRDPSKAYSRNPYLGRYHVEEDKFSEVPARRLVSHSAREVNVCKDIDLALRHVAPHLNSAAVVLATWGSTWSSTPSENWLSKRIYWASTQQGVRDRFSATGVLRS